MYKPIVSLLLFLSGYALHATHIVGGELIYRCLGNDNYEITLNVYRDCYNGVPWFDDPAAVGIFDVDHNLLENLLLPLTSINDTLDIFLNNPCVIEPPDVCVHRTTYQAQVLLPPRPGGYQIVYQRCCRNMLIRNIPDPEAVGITIIAVIDETALDLCNQGAYFNNWPPLAICVGEPIDFDHSATDPDGDSLHYRLCTPYAGATVADPMPQPPNAGPYIELIWTDPPYNLSNLLGGVPLTIDPDNGFMTGIPNLVGNFVVGVCVDEYRDGQLITTTRRDFQYNVADCGKPVAAASGPERQCNNLTVDFINSSEINTNSTFYQWYFDWGGDLSLASNESSPTFTYPDTGHYVAALILNPGFTCSDTVFVDVWLTSTTATAGVEVDLSHCNEAGVQVQLNDLSIDPLYTVDEWQWTVTRNGETYLVSTEQNPTVLLNQSGEYTATLQTVSSNGCSNDTTFTFEIFIPPIENLPETATLCAGDTVDLFPNAPANYTYQWSPASDITSVTAPNPQVFPIETVQYMVTMTSPDNACTRVGVVDVLVVSEGNLVASADPVIIVSGQSSQLTAFFPGEVEYVWTPAATLSDPNIANPVATPTDTTIYTVTVITSSGCMPTDTVLVIVLPAVCDLPFIFFPTGFSPNGDGENERIKLEGIYIDEVYWVIYDRWGEKIFEADSVDDAWDGTYQGKDLPAETYGYYLRVRCFGGQILEKKGNVTLLR